MLTANDLVAAWGGKRLMEEELGLKIGVMAGPATDNEVGVQQIDERTSLPAINALSNPVALGDMVADLLRKETS